MPFQIIRENGLEIDADEFGNALGLRLLRLYGSSCFREFPHSRKSFRL